MDAELQQYLERLERKFDAFVSLFEQTEARTEERFGQLEVRIAQVAARITEIEAASAERYARQEARRDRVERRLDALEGHIRDGFSTVQERLQAMALANEQFERRVQSSLTDMQHDLAKLSAQVNSLAERTTSLEDALLLQTERLNGLSDDMRQRFRVVNDRLAQLAA